MKNKLAKFLLVGCIACQCVGGLQAQTLWVDGKKIEYQLPPISLYVNQKPVQTTVMDPIQLNDRVLVPAREVFEAMGAKVEWNHVIKEVVVKYKDKVICLVVNQTEATINGAEVFLDVPAKIINDKVMIPIRFVSEAMGMKVTWNGQKREVWIEEPVVESDSESQKKTEIQSVIASGNGSKYTVEIYASSGMEEVQVTPLGDKLVFDIPSSKCLLNSSITVADNTYIKGIRTSQFTAEATRIVLDLKTSVEMEKRYSSDRKILYVTLTKKGNTSTEGTKPSQPSGGNDTTIGGGTGSGGGSNQNGNTSNEGNGTVQKPEQNQAFYVPGYKPLLQLGVLCNNIKVTEQYRQRTLVFDLGADYSKKLPNTEMKPNDAQIASISINTSGTTKITVVSKSVYAYEIIQKGNSTSIQLVKPREKYKQIVVVDIGHGGSDAGAVGNGLTEKEINFNQGMALFALLEADPNIKVYMTRETDVYPTLQFRSQLANDINADIFVSLHNNSASSNVRGTETLYFPSTTDQTGKTIAGLVQKNIIKYCGTVDRGIKPRSDLYVLKTTNMPAILIETGFISNASEAHLINSPSFINKWAQGVYEALIEGLKYTKR